MHYAPGIEFGLGSLPLLSDAKTRSISAENPTGERELVVRLFQTQMIQIYLIQETLSTSGKAGK